MKLVLNCATFSTPTHHAFRCKLSSTINMIAFCFLRAKRSNPGAASRGPWIASSQGFLAMTGRVIVILRRVSDRLYRGKRMGGAAYGLRRLSEGAEEASAHPLTVAKAGFLSDSLDRQASLLE